tara:strand:- start:10125 stop:10745 length:621 start_codon:yes stop_codon:yes gene_type:complete
MDTKETYSLLSARISFLKKDIKISKAIIDRTTPIFHEEFMRSMGYLTDDQKKEKKQKTIQLESSSEEYKQQLSEPCDLAPKEKKNPKLKGIFKKIAQAIHPDKMLDKPEFEKKYKKDLYDHAIIALDKDDYYTLCEISEELGLPPIEHTPEMVESMRGVVKKLEEEQKAIKGSIVWSWYTTSEENKPAVMEKYVEYYKKRRNNPGP